MASPTPETTARIASEAFWAVVAALHPTATTGDLGPVQTSRFTRVTESAVEEWLALNDPGYDVTVTVHPSAGSDGAIVVEIDTEFEPDGRDGGPGLRVNINDGDAWTGVAYAPQEDTP